MLCAALAGGCAVSEGPRVAESARLGRAPIEAPPDALIDVYWKLIELNGRPAPHGSGGKEAHLLLQVNKPVVRGFAGCNRFSGRYELAGNRVAFSELVATRMACAEGMELEREYLEALPRVRTWAREEDRLILSDEAGGVVARFMARPL